MDTLTKTLKQVIEKKINNTKVECMFCGAVFIQNTDADITCNICQSHLDNNKFCMDCLCPSWLCNCNENDYKYVTGKDMYVKPKEL